VFRRRTASRCFIGTRNALLPRVYQKSASGVPARRGAMTRYVVPAVTVSASKCGIESASTGWQAGNPPIKRCHRPNSVRERYSAQRSWCVMRTGMRRLVQELLFTEITSLRCQCAYAAAA